MLLLTYQPLKFLVLKMLLNFAVDKIHIHIINVGFGQNFLHLI